MFIEKNQMKGCAEEYGYNTYIDGICWECVFIHVTRFIANVNFTILSSVYKLCK